MNKITKIFLLLFVLVLSIVFLLVLTTKPKTPPETSNSPDTINIKEYSFSPSTLTVKAGTTVTWTNNDPSPHNIKSSAFKSPDIDPGGTFKFTFDTPGTFNYNCGIHPTMAGTIVVE